MLEIGQAAVLLMIVVGLFVNRLIVKKLETGVVNLLYISFGFSIFFIGLSVLFHMALDWDIYHISEESAHSWLHLIVYVALASLVWGGYRVKQCIDTESVVGFESRDRTFFVSLLALVALMFLLPDVLEPSIGPRLEGTIVEIFGLHHFVVFAGALAAGIYLHIIKGKWGQIGSTLKYAIFFLLLISLQHGWELITESWKIFVPEDVVIETVELVLLLVGVYLLTLGQWNFYKQIRD